MHKSAVLLNDICHNFHKAELYTFVTPSPEQELKKNAVLSKKLESTQEELMKTQIKYQKEIEKLEKENKELRKQLLLRQERLICSCKKYKFNLH